MISRWFWNVYLFWYLGCSGGQKWRYVAEMRFSLQPAALLNLISKVGILHCYTWLQVCGKWKSEIMCVDVFEKLPKLLIWTWKQKQTNNIAISYFLCVALWKLDELVMRRRQSERITGIMVALEDSLPRGLASCFCYFLHIRNSNKLTKGLVI